jgi:IS4 transposase
MLKRLQNSAPGWNQVRIIFHPLHRPADIRAVHIHSMGTSLPLFVKRNADGTFFALITNKKYFRATRAMDIYRGRWGIENLFNENGFLGLDHLPSLELNAIQTALTQLHGFKKVVVRYQ